MRELVPGLLEGGPDLAASPGEARLVFEELLVTILVAGDLEFEETRLGGVGWVRCAFAGTLR